jgi:hypothetical protein
MLCVQKKENHYRAIVSKLQAKKNYPAIFSLKWAPQAKPAKFSYLENHILSDKWPIFI